MNAPVTPASIDTLMHLPLHAVAPDPRQDRKHFESAALQELADNIAQCGVVQPIVVRPPFEGEWARIPPPGQLQAQYILIAGERRWRASQLAGLAQIPAIIKTGLSPADVLVIQAVENLQRKDLTLREQATLCARLVNECGDLDAACIRVNKSKAWVSLRASVLGMPPEVRNLVDTGAIRDVQIANSLAQLQELSEYQYQRYVRAFTEPDEDGITPSRAEVAETVQWAKKQKQAEAERAAQQAERDAQRAQQQGGEEDEDDEYLTEHNQDDAEDEAHWARVEAHNEKLSAFEESTGTQLNALLKLKPDPSTPHLSLLRLHAQWNDDEPIVDDIEQNSFLLSAYDLPLTALDRLDDCLMPDSLRVYCELQDLTLAQARAIEKIAGKPLEWSTRAVATGEHLRGLVNALSAPPPSALTAEDFLAAWLQRHVKRQKGAPRLQAKDVHAAYAAACQRQALAPFELTSNAWGAAIAAAGIEKVRSNGTKYTDIVLSA